MLTATSPSHAGAERAGVSHYQPTSDTACLAIVWVDGIANDIQEEQILAMLSSQAGVNQAMFSLHNPDILVVDYDRQKTRSLDLLERIELKNVRAKIVGC